MRKTKYILGFLALAMLVGAIAWWWHGHMERKWEARQVFHSESEDIHRGLELFLKRQGIGINLRPNLAKAEEEIQPDEAIFLSLLHKERPSEENRWLLDWVDRGGTLWVQSSWKLDMSSDTLFQALGVRTQKRDTLESDEEEDTTEGLVPKSPNDSFLPEMESMPSDTPRQILPGLPDPDSLADPDSGSFEPLVAKRNSPDSAKSSDSGTTIHLGGDSLVWSSVSPKMPRLIDEETPTSKVLWRDSLDSSLLVVAKGKGIVIVSATGLRIADFDFCRFDHAELFLRFLSWKAKPKNVWLISDSTFPSWAQWLWFHAWAVLLWIFALLGLWILGRARRFGPILSDEEPERRPLLEHIDASARWIWNAPDGPQTLLSALRDSVRQKLAWRHPAWSRLPLGELSQELSRLHKVSAKATQRALDPNSPTHSPTAQEFTKMVRILQQLKETP